MTQCTRTFPEITCCMDCSLVFQKEEFNRNCIDAVYSRTSCSLILTTIMWLVLCALTIIKHDLFLAKLKSMILTYNCLENLANRRQYVRKNGTNLTLVLHNGSLEKEFYASFYFLLSLTIYPQLLLISSLIIPPFPLVSTFSWEH